MREGGMSALPTRSGSKSAHDLRCLEIDAAHALASHQIGWWKSRGISALTASAGIGMLPQYRWGQIEDALVCKWLKARAINRESRKVAA
jgi:hypothetical protein